MALDSSLKNKILRELPSDYRLAYSQGTLDDAFLERYADKLGIQADDFSGVSARVDSSEQSPDPAYDPWGDSSTVDRLQGGVQGLVGGQLSTLASKLTSDEDTGMMRGGMGPVALVKNAVEAVLSDEQQAALARRNNEIISPFTNKLVEWGGSLMDAADANNAIADEGMKNRAEEYGEGFLATPRRWADETINDVLGSPSSAASLAGGPFAAIGGMDVYGQTYARALRAGVNEADADLQATAAATAEIATSVIPATKLIDKVTGGAGGRWVADTIREKVVKGAVKTALGEGFQEGVTQVAQTEANRLLSVLAEDPTTKAYLEKQLPTTGVEYFNQVIRAGRAGAATGAPVGAAVSRHEAIAQAAKDYTDTINAVSKNERLIPNRPVQGPREGTAEEQSNALSQRIIEAGNSWLTGGPTGAGANPIQNTPINGAATRAENQRLADQMPVRQDERPQDAQDFIQSPVGAVSRANTIPTANNPVAVPGELEFNQTMADAITARNDALKGAKSALGKEASTAKRSAAGKLSAAKRAHLLKVQKATVGLPQATRERMLADAALSFDANVETAPEAAPPNAGVQMPATSLPFEQELPVGAPVTAQEAAQASPVSSASTPAPTTPSAQARTEARAAEAEAQRQEGIAKLMKEDPTLSREEAEDAFTPSTTPESEADVRAIYGEPLNSNDTTPEAPASGMTAESFITAVAEQQGQSRTANSVGKLIRDGKMVVVNNAEELGEGTDPNVRAQYDPESGTLYVNAAQMDKDNPVGSLLAEVATHEVDHAARVSGNSDVRNAASAILGVEKGKRFINYLNTSSDPIAEEARTKAKASGETGDRRDLELAAYAMQAAAREYANTKGLPALWRGVVSAARTTAQKYIPGIDVNVKDLGYLGDKMLEAAAATKQSLAGDIDAPLNTILSRESTGFDQAQREGITYMSKDGAEKFVISDAESTIRPGAIKKLLNGDTLKLSEVLDHPELYDNIPSMKNLLVSVYDNGSGAFATYLPDTNTEGDGEIILSPALAEGKTNVDLRGAILHEAQHHVQNQDSVRRENFYNQTTDRSPEEIELVGQFRELADVSNKSVRKFLDRMQSIMKQVSSTAVKRAMSNVVFDSNLTDAGKARELAGYVQDEGLVDFLDEAEQVLADMDAYNKLVPEVNAARESYFENITEQEAFFTQDNASNPNPAMNPEQGSFVRPVTRGKGGKRLNSLAQPALPQLDIPYEPSLARKTWDTVKNGALWSGAAGKAVKLLSDWQEGFQSNIAARAAVYFHRLNPAKEKLAHKAVAAGKYPNIKEARAGINNMIRDRFDAINAIPDKRRRDTMIARFVQQYPELQALQDAINDINSLTDDYISQRMRDSKPLSEEELTQIKYMIANKSKYLTTVYTAFQGKTGDAYVAKLYRDLASANALLAKGKALPAPLKKVFEDYQRAVRFIARNDVAVSDPEHLNSLPLEAVRNLYDLWRPTGSLNAEGVQNQMATSPEKYDEQKYKDYLSDVIRSGVSKADQATYDKHAQQILKNILTQVDTGIARRYMRGSKLDESLLEHKTDIPQELRTIYGEVTDVPALMAITMSKQSELAARARMLADLKEQHTGDLVIEGNSEERAKPENKKFTAELKGESWGPLEGMYTTPELLLALGDYTESVADLTTSVALSAAAPNVLTRWAMNTGTSGLKMLGKGYKMATVVFSPVHVAMNMAGSAASLTMAGGVRPKHAMEGMRLALGLIAETAFPEGVAGWAPKNSRARDNYFRFSIGESAQMQNMRQEPLDILKKIVQEAHTTKTDDVLGFFSEMKEKYGAPAVKTIIEMVAQSDAWAKYPMFLQRAEDLEKFYKANGDNKSIEDVYKEAADFAKDVGMSYDRTAPVLRSLENIPVFGTFMPYIQSTFRSIGYAGYHVGRGVERAINAKTPAAKLIASGMVARQAAGLSLVLSAPLIYQGIANAINDDEEEEAIEAERGLMEDRFKYGNLIAIGKNAEGKNLYFQGSRLDARGPVTDIGRILMSDEDKETKWQAVQENLTGLWIKPQIGGAMAKLFMDITTDEAMKDKNTRLERMFPLITEKYKSLGTAMGADYSTMNSAIEVMDKLMPSAFNWFDPKQQKVDPATSETAAAGMLLAASGYRLAVADPESAALYAGLDYDKMKREGRAAIASNLGNVGPEAAVAEFRDQAATERRAIARVGRVYESMLKVGMSQQEATQALKELKIFDAADIANIRNKTYEANDDEWAKEYSTLLSAQSLQKRGEKDEKVKENVDGLKKLIDELGYKKMKENR